jgi:DNA-directed RNA polymerase II subunit RPB2
MISHGAARFLKERLFDVSDSYRMHICEQCGLICQANLAEQKFECTVCQSSQSICKVAIPYACKLLIQELMALQIAPRLRVNNH